jgi:hypothetical protein
MPPKSPWGDLPGSRVRQIDSVVHRVPQFLFAAEIPFGGLHRGMPEQKLNLLEFSSGDVTEPRTTSTQVMRSEVRDAFSIAVSAPAN